MNWTDILEKLRRYGKYDATGLVVIWRGESRCYYEREWCCPDAALLARVPKQDLDRIGVGKVRG